MNVPAIEYILTHLRCLSQMLRCYYPEFYEYIQQFSGNTSEQCYQYFYGRPVCKICGGPLRYKNFFRGYGTYCSGQCAGKDKSLVDVRKNTCLKKYGDANYNNKSKTSKTNKKRYGGTGFASKELKKKVEETCMKRYGIENPTGLPQIRQKMEQTKLRKYQDKNFNNRQKCRNTCLKLYGVENPQQNKEVQNKFKETMRSRYGVYYTLESDELRKRVSKTMKQRYGVFKALQSEQIKSKTFETNIEKYGVPYGFLNAEPGYSKSSQEYFKTLDRQYPNAIYATKGGEHRVGPYLLDWYDPDTNTCIEFNGDYWHANPKLYDKDWIHPLSHKTAQEIWEYDKRRKEYIKSQGIDVKVVWESEIKKDLS